MNKYILFFLVFSFAGCNSEYYLTSEDNCSYEYISSGAFGNGENVLEDGWFVCPRIMFLNGYLFLRGEYYVYYNYEAEFHLEEYKVVDSKGRVIIFENSREVPPIESEMDDKWNSYFVIHGKHYFDSEFIEESEVPDYFDAIISGYYGDDFKEVTIRYYFNLY